MAQAPKHTFTLGDKDFLLDGKPFQIIAGEMHFARIPKEYWRHRLKMARAMGLNTIATYVFWNYHENERGTFDFTTESRNIAEFIKIAQEEGLWVIVRPGPYACAEWEFGGYPWWLLKQKDLVVRGRDQRFLHACEKYLNRLGEEISSLQITHGGPIIMVQVENEYGSFGSDKEYMSAMRDYIRHSKFDVPLFTADGPGQCKNGSVADVLPAINGDDIAKSIRDTVNKWNHSKGPYFSPEFYPGWLDHWGEQHSIVSLDDFIGKYDTLLSEGVSISLYMFHGGTNFSFTNGANYSGHYQPQPTSYDYDAPLDEAGRPTSKYFRFRDVISRHLSNGVLLPDIPPTNPMIEIERFELKEAMNLFDALPKPVTSRTILSMEDVGQGSGYIVYRTTVNTKGEGTLVFNELRDYGIVFLNGKKVASLDRRHKQKKLTVDVSSTPAVLDILVENGGRINFGRQMTDNRKGITERVLFNGRELVGWEIFPLPMETLSSLHFTQKDISTVPAFHRGTFSVTKTGDTFLDMSGWGKGCVWINDHNLGRFWHIGPQQTLYCPGVWLNEGNNEIVVLELEDRGKRSVQGLNNPILNQLHPDELARSLPQRKPGVAQFNPSDMIIAGSFAEGDSEQVVRFKEISVRYVCLRSLSSLRGDPFASIAELYVLDGEGKKLDREKWNVFSVESEELSAEDGRAENSFDEDVESIWHTQWANAKPNHPHQLVIDMGKEQIISGFVYQSRRGNAPGKIKGYEWYARRQPFELK
ncbi:MAG: beta-galactosidase [Ignavibacteria bacterium]|nr:beta-galactosidase [Ignavibacteria bacterium]